MFTNSRASRNTLGSDRWFCKIMEMVSLRLKNGDPLFLCFFSFKSSLVRNILPHTLKWKSNAAENHSSTSEDIWWITFLLGLNQTAAYRLKPAICRITTIATIAGQSLKLYHLHERSFFQV